MRTPTEKLEEMVRKGPGQRDVPSRSFLRLCVAYMEHLERQLVLLPGYVRLETFYKAYNDKMQQEQKDADEKAEKAIMERMRRGARR